MVFLCYFCLKFILVFNLPMPFCQFNVEGNFILRELFLFFLFLFPPYSVFFQLFKSLLSDFLLLELRFIFLLFFSHFFFFHQSQHFLFFSFVEIFPFFSHLPMLSRPSFNFFFYFFILSIFLIFLLFYLLM